MMRWLEIPAHRILEVSREDVNRDFIRLNTEGKEPAPGERVYRFVRNSDNKVFRLARYWPNDAVELYMIYLEEI